MSLQLAAASYIYIHCALKNLCFMIYLIVFGLQHPVAVIQCTFTHTHTQHLEQHNRHKQYIEQHNRHKQYI